MAVEDLEVANLLLDPQNPRLPDFVIRDTESILSYLTKSSAVDELIDAIGENGYFEDEPLIGVRDGTSVVIVEGNRRLTALKLLDQFRGSTAEEIDQQAELPAKVRSSLKQANHAPQRVPVALHDRREDVLVYLGNKHIAGVKPWGSLAKAKYVKQLMEQPQFSTGDYSQRIREIARSIGSRSDYIKRSLRSLSAYDEARDKNYFDLPGLSEEKVKFSRLSSALDYANILEFATGEVEPEYPVSYDPKKLAELFKWLFVQDEKGNTILGDTRNLRQLAEVVKNEAALLAVRRGKTLTAAYRMTSGVEVDFDNLTSNALEQLQRANAIAAEVDATDARIDDASALFKQARALRRSLESDLD